MNLNLALPASISHIQAWTHQMHVSCVLQATTAEQGMPIQLPVMQDMSVRQSLRRPSLAVEFSKVLKVPPSNTLALPRLTVQLCHTTLLYVQPASSVLASEQISTQSVIMEHTVVREPDSLKTALLVTSAPVTLSTTIKTRVVLLVAHVNILTQNQLPVRIALKAMSALPMPHSPIPLLPSKVDIFALLARTVQRQLQHLSPVQSRTIQTKKVMDS